MLNSVELVKRRGDSNLFVYMPYLGVICGVLSLKLLFPAVFF